MITVQEALASVVSNLAHAVADRCEDVLPEVELREAFPYFLALWQHGAQGTEGTFAELLALQLKVEPGNTRHRAQRARLLSCGNLAPDGRAGGV